MTSPFAETNEPDPPLLNLTDANCTFFSHASVTSKPYFRLISARGTLLKGHMPSSARAVRFSACTAKNAVKSAHANFLNFIREPLIGNLSGDDLDLLLRQFGCLCE